MSMTRLCNGAEQGVRGLHRAGGQGGVSPIGWMPTYTWHGWEVPPSPCSWVPHVR